MPRRRIAPPTPPERSFMDLAVNYFLDAPVNEINVLMPVIYAIVSRRMAEVHPVGQTLGEGTYTPEPVATPMSLPDPEPVPVATLDPNPLRTARRRRRRASATVGPVAVPPASDAGAVPYPEAQELAHPVEQVEPYDGTVGDPDPDVVQG